jgi:hypothetical protein
VPSPALSIASLRSNTSKIRQTFDRQGVDCNLVVLKIALRQLLCKVLRHLSALPYEQFNSCFGSTGKCDARHFVLNGAARKTPPSRGAGGGPSCTQTGPGPPKAPPWRREKKAPPPPPRALLPQITPEAAKSPRERVPTFSNPCRGPLVGRFWGGAANGTQPPTARQGTAQAGGIQRNKGLTLFLFLYLRFGRYTCWPAQSDTSAWAKRTGCPSNASILSASD